MAEPVNQQLADAFVEQELRARRVETQERLMHPIYTYQKGARSGWREGATVDYLGERWSVSVAAQYADGGTTYRLLPVEPDASATLEEEGCDGREPSSDHC